MTQEHPIIPLPELVKQWEGTAYNAAPIPYTHHIARCAARWGADQELEACCEWFSAERGYHPSVATDLRTGRRPMPPSLKEQALGLLNEGPVSDLLDDEVAVIRRALESLPD